MEMMLINKKTVRHNKAMKTAQRLAARRYGRVRKRDGGVSAGKAPKLKISKVAVLNSDTLISFPENANTTMPTPEKGTGEIPNLSAQELIAKLAGEKLLGLSGGGFPTAEKLKRFVETREKAGYLIINAVECEPSLLHDEWILTHCYEEVKLGIEILEKSLALKKTYIAAKIGNPGVGSEACYVQVPNRYPIGQEKLLIRWILGTELQNSDIPVEKGILVLNIQTVLAIGRIVRNAEKKNFRYFTAIHLSDATASIVEAPMGMNAEKIAKKLANSFSYSGNIYIGGGIMCTHILTEADIINASTCVLAFGDAVVFQETKCKGCGACTANCPGGVDVRGIIRAMEKGQTANFEQFHPERCIGCWACSYVCHAGKNVTKQIVQINERTD